MSASKNTNGTERAEWMAGLKPGDQVAVRHGYVHRSFTIDVVERVMPSQITVQGVRGYRFRKSDGGVVGGDNMRLVEPTQAVRDEVRRDALAERFRHTQWGALPLPLLEQVASALPD